MTQSVHGNCQDPILAKPAGNTTNEQHGDRGRPAGTCTNCLNGNRWRAVEMALMPLPALGEIAAVETALSCQVCARQRDEAITVTRTRAHVGSPQNENGRILAQDGMKVK